MEFWTNTSLKNWKKCNDLWRASERVRESERKKGRKKRERDVIKYKNLTSNREFYRFNLKKSKKTKQKIWKFETKWNDPSREEKHRIRYFLNIKYKNLTSKKYFLALIEKQNYFSESIFGHFKNAKFSFNFFSCTITIIGSIISIR